MGIPCDENEKRPIMRVLIVVARFVGSFGDFYQFPLGLAYVTGAVKNAGHEVFGLNLNHVFGLETNLVEEKVRECSADVCMTGTLSPFLPQIRRIFAGARRGNTDILNIGGCGVVSGDPEVSLDLMDMDLGVVGEGEFTIVEVLDAYKNGSDWAKIKGIVFKNKNGEVIHTCERPAERDLTLYPWPEYDLLGFSEHVHLQRPLDHHFFQTQPHNQPRAIDMITSRSCPFMCTFCFHPVGKVYRERPLEDFFKELQHYVDKYQVNMVAILDELFSLRQERLLEFCERIKPMNLQWMVQLHVRTGKPHVLEAMAASGCSYISYGIESMSQPILESMAKKSTTVQIDATVQRTYKAKIGLQGNLIFGDTAETLQTANESMSWWAHNRHLQIYLSRIQVFPGSPDYIMAVRDELITDRKKFCEELPLQMNFSNTNTPNYTEMMFQLGVHSVTLLNLAPVSRFEPSEVQIEERDTAFDINWCCPRCEHTNNYRQCVLREDHRHFIRVFCRECHSRWDIINHAFGIRSRSADLDTGVIPQKANQALVGGGSNFEYDELKQSLSQQRAMTYAYKKEESVLKEIRAAGMDLLKAPFDPERHLRFANALKEAGGFGAARLHFQQAINAAAYWRHAGEKSEKFFESRYQEALVRLISHPDYPRLRETYFVSYSDEAPPFRSSRTTGGYRNEHEPSFPSFKHADVARLKPKRAAVKA